MASLLLKNSVTSIYMLDSSIGSKLLFQRPSALVGRVLLQEKTYIYLSWISLLVLNFSKRSSEDHLLFDPISVREEKANYQSTGAKIRGKQSCRKDAATHRAKIFKY